MLTSILDFGKYSDNIHLLLKRLAKLCIIIIRYKTLSLICLNSFTEDEESSEDESLDGGSGKKRNPSAASTSTNEEDDDSR